METNEISLEFSDFVPDFGFKDFLALTAERLQCGAPSDSNVRLAIKRSGDSVKVICRIVSFAGTFIGEAINRSAYLATEEVESMIVRQLNVWKVFRFSEIGSD